jgi:CMP-N-acetylneuraminic acid synthetase
MPNKKLIALIPARAGSERIKHKNFRPFCGTPLVVLTVIAAFLSGIFDDIAVSTDEPGLIYKLINNVRNDKGMRDKIKKELIVHNRPAEISGPRNSDCEWIADILEALGWVYGHYMILRPTNPFRQPKTMQRAWQEYKTKFNMAISMKSVQLVSERPEKMWKPNLSVKYRVVKIHPTLLPLIPIGENTAQWGYEAQSSVMQDLYVQNGCIDICPASIIKNNRNRYIGDIISPFRTTLLEGIDLNTELDWQMAEALWHSMNNKQRQFASGVVSQKIH